jgi:hypothetical protein
VQNQWGGDDAPWHDGGTWNLGARSNQNVVGINISSADGGNSFSGDMTYAGEGPIGFRAQRTAPNVYSVENQWGGDQAPWHPGGDWTIGSRSDQNVVALQVSSPDGSMLVGTNTYNGEGPIGFRGEPQP